MSKIVSIENSIDQVSYLGDKTLASEYVGENVIGNKSYELSNHLGNILVTISDAKTPKGDAGNNLALSYVPRITSMNDYYPFGMLMPNRQYSQESYRYGFNGMERDDEVAGGGNSYSTEFRQFDPRLGRWLSVDPVTHHHFSPYSSFDNNPIFYVDPLGSNAGDYYDFDTGEYLGTDRVNDGLSYLVDRSTFETAEKANTGSTADAKKTAYSSLSTSINTSDVPKYQRIIGQYNQIIADARADGKNVAADHLQHFLDGSGTDITVDADWLLSFGSVQDAVGRNHGRFEDQIDSKYSGLLSGQTTSFSDYWDAMETASVFGELYYASGTFTVTSSADISMSRQNSLVTIMGTETVTWHDPYDWHAGLGAYIPGHGNISDSDALWLQQFGKAKPFNMTSTWSYNLSGTITINSYWFDSIDLNWNRR